MGPATHYHADYVAPYWAPTLVKLAQIGAHIFYRWTGPQGELSAFNGRYAGGEANLTAAILQSDDVRAPNLPPGTAVAAAPAPRVVQLTAQDGQTRSYVVSDTPMALGGGSVVGTAGMGVLTPTRRRPTREEVAAINAALAGLPEAKVDAARAQAAPAPK